MNGRELGNWRVPSESKSQRDSSLRSRSSVYRRADLARDYVGVAIDVVEVLHLARASHRSLSVQSRIAYCSSSKCTQRSAILLGLRARRWTASWQHRVTLHEALLVGCGRSIITTVLNAFDESLLNIDLIRGGILRTAREKQADADYAD
jgi:hypothetical protein